MPADRDDSEKTMTEAQQRYNDERSNFKPDDDDDDDKPTPSRSRSDDDKDDDKVERDPTNSYD